MKRRFLAVTSVLLVLMLLVSVTARAQGVDGQKGDLPSEPDVIKAVAADGPASPDRIAAYAERLEGAAAHDPEEAMLRGIAWDLAGKPEKARGYYEAVLAEMPTRPDLYLRLANVLPEGVWVFADGKPVTFSDATPLIQNGRTLVPFRALAEALGGEVKWDPETHTATIRLGRREIKLTQDSNIADLNGGGIQLDVPATIIPPGRFAVPLRFVGESLGYEVKWFNVRGGAVIGLWRTSDDKRNEAPPVPPNGVEPPRTGEVPKIPEPKNPNPPAEAVAPQNPEPTANGQNQEGGK